MTMNSKKYNIICLSNQLWDFPSFTNKRLVMQRLAERGHDVIFVDPPINVGFVFLKQIKKGLWGLRRMLTQQKRTEEEVLVYTPLKLFPNTKITSKMHIDRINRIVRKRLKSDQKTVLWVYHVQMASLQQYLDNINYDILVYDCVDNYTAFPQESTFYSTIVPKEKVEEQEISLTERADIVFATAPGLVDKLKKHNENVYYTPNVGDYQRFKNVRKLKSKLPTDIKDIPRPRIGYIGALDNYKFDYALVRKLVKDHPSYHFVIIGPIALKDREASLDDLGFEGFENVHFLGSRPYDQKQYYLAGFDADIIPYVLNDYTVGGCFPVKFHDSLAAGLPVVVTDMPAYIPFKDVCYISKNYDEFSENLTKAIEEDSPEKVKERQEVAKENTWDKKVDEMLRILTDLKNKNRHSDT
jgi:glycosyltransferase involved in cell wall biosynthesis